MVKVIFRMSVSIDACIEGPNREKTVFGGITRRHPLRLLSTRTFKSGNVELIDEPIRA